MRREGPWLRLGLAGAGWQERENAGRAGGGGGRGRAAPSPPILFASGGGSAES